MDPVTLAYYGLICGGLGFVAPRINPGLLRIAVGVAVGLVAAAALPPLRQALGI